MTTQKKFASHADLEVKKVSFDKLSDNAYAYTAEGDPNTGIIIGDDAVMVIDTQAHTDHGAGRDPPYPHRHRQADHTSCCRTITRVRVLGASGYKTEGAEHIIASQDTYDLIVERGEQDKASEIGRFRACSRPSSRCRRA